MGYDYPRCRRYLHRRGTKVRIARRGIEAKTHLGRHRWAVGRTISWPLRFRCPGLRYDRTVATLLPLLLLAVTTALPAGHHRSASQPGPDMS
jgi:hypothetical protein